MESRRWKTLLTTSILGHSAGEQLGMAMRLRRGTDAEAPAVVRAILRPHITLAARLPSDGAREDGLPDAELSWRTQAGELDKVLTRSAPSDETEALRLLGLAEDALSAAYEMLEGYRGELDFDPLSFRRTAIEQHVQDRHRRDIDAIIDALRDLGERLLSGTPYLSDKWWMLGFPLFRRLALHLVDVDADRSPDNKLRWLLDRVDLYAPEEQHEVYRVLATSVPFASSPLRLELLRRVKQGPLRPSEPSARTIRSAYAVYNLLGWLRASAPDWQELQQEHDAIERQNPTFEPRDHPDVSHWVTGGGRKDPLHLSAEDLVAMVARDSAAAADFVLGQEYPDLSFDDVSWEDIAGLLTSTARAAPTTAVTLWTALTEAPDVQARRDTAVTALILGLAEADLDDIHLVVRDKIRAEVGNATATHAIARFLRLQVESDALAEDTLFVSGLRDIARRLWMANEAAYTSDDGWACGTLSWPGLIATYWVLEIDRRRRTSDQPTDALCNEEREALDALLAGTSDALSAVNISLAADVHFFSARIRRTRERTSFRCLTTTIWRRTCGAHISKTRELTRSCYRRGCLMQCRRNGIASGNSRTKHSFKTSSHW